MRDEGGNFFILPPSTFNFPKYPSRTVFVRFIEAIIPTWYVHYYKTIDEYVEILFSSRPLFRQ